MKTVQIASYMILASLAATSFLTSCKGRPEMVAAGKRTGALDGTTNPPVNPPKTGTTKPPGEPLVGETDPPVEPPIVGTDPPVEPPIVGIDPPVEPPPPPPPEPTLRELLTKAQFDKMLPHKIPFYTYEGFMEAAEAVGKFAKEGTTEQRKREIAAILANARHESDEFKATNEYNTAVWSHYCDTTYGKTCAPGKTYHGRGPIQLSWNYNYLDAGKDLGIDLWGNPDLVASDPKIAFSTMMWFWTKRTAKVIVNNRQEDVSCHDAMIKGKGGFGATISVINGGLECKNTRTEVQRAQVVKRVKNYNELLKEMGLSEEGYGIDCVNVTPADR